ncbi:MAG: phytoene desaturase family protein [Candidatus Promineifilaceae bacterium]|nr:phytoene desaturase family protein [Candidatus Promineifilaceae bacterium]
MERDRSAIVIGAGLGGIATAARLARNGYDVTVVEKNSQAGGRCNQIWRDGHRFDIGPTLFLMPEVFAETYAAVGERMEEHLHLHRIDPTYRIYFQDGLELALTADLQKMQEQLEAIEPGSFGGLLRYLAEGHRHYKMSLKHFVGRNFYSLLDYFSPRNLPLLFQLKALVKHYDNIDNYFSDPRLKAAFTFQNMYLGLSPYDAPATYSLLQYTELADGVYFPEGGMYRIIESLVEIAESHGARFLYDAPVTAIEIADGQATGVRLEDGRTLSADVVVANADLPYVYEHLLQDEAQTEKLAKKKYTCSAIMFYWGVDKVYPELGHHNVFLADEYKASFDRIFQDYTLPDDPSFYVHAPARTDAAAAPAGEDTLMVLVPVGHLSDEVRQEWPALQARARETVLHGLKKIGVDDLEEHLKFEISYTPLDWQREYNLARGAAFGLSHNFTQVGYLRPQNRHPQYHNLYFVGASTHPGTGLPIVLLSARLTTERILRDAGVEEAMPALRPAAA